MLDFWLKIAKEMTLKRNDDGTHNVTIKMDSRDDNDVITETEISFKANITNFECNILIGFDDHLLTLTENI
jgi:hypothetical protein